MTDAVNASGQPGDWCTECFTVRLSARPPVCQTCETEGVTAPSQEQLKRLDHWLTTPTALPRNLQTEKPVGRVNDVIAAEPTDREASGESE